MNDDRGNPSSPSIDDRAKRAEHGEQPPAPPAPSCVMVIFGASGDLTRRKLVPALFNLRAGGLLPTSSSCSAWRASRCPTTSSGRGSAKIFTGATRVEERPRIAATGFSADVLSGAATSEQPGIYGRFQARIDGARQAVQHLENVLFYLAVAPPCSRPS